MKTKMTALIAGALLALSAGLVVSGPTLPDASPAPAVALRDTLPDDPADAQEHLFEEIRQHTRPA